MTEKQTVAYARHGDRMFYDAIEKHLEPVLTKKLYIKLLDERMGLTPLVIETIFEKLWKKRKKIRHKKDIWRIAKGIMEREVRKHNRRPVPQDIRFKIDEIGSGKDFVGAKNKQGNFLTADQMLKVFALRKYLGVSHAQLKRIMTHDAKIVRNRETGETEIRFVGPANENTLKTRWHKSQNKRGDKVNAILDVVIRERLKEVTAERRKRQTPRKPLDY